MLYLETPRFILRDYVPSDEEVYFHLKSDPKTMYYLPDIRLFTREEARQDFGAVLADLLRGRLFYLPKILGQGVYYSSLPKGFGICFYSERCLSPFHRLSGGKRRLRTRYAKMRSHKGGHTSRFRMA